MADVYAAFIRGQGGFFTSPGIDLLAADARRQGVVADVFNYSDWQAVENVIRQNSAMGDKVAVVGYSLGDSTGTYLGTRDKIDLLVCIFESTFGQNYPVNHANVARSVLVHGTGFLSSAGLADKFDRLVEVDEPLSDIPLIGSLAGHLAGQFAPAVVETVLGELATLQKEAST